MKDIKGEELGKEKKGLDTKIKYVSSFKNKIKQEKPINKEKPGPLKEGYNPVKNQSKFIHKALWYHFTPLLLTVYYLFIFIITFILYVTSSYDIFPLLGLISILLTFSPLFYFFGTARNLKKIKKIYADIEDEEDKKHYKKHYDFVNEYCWYGILFIILNNFLVFNGVPYGIPFIIFLIWWIYYVVKLFKFKKYLISTRFIVDDGTERGN